MKKNVLRFIQIALMLFVFGMMMPIVKAQPKVIDIDNNVYDTIHAGTQVWLKQNLKVTHYRNGDAIPNITKKKAWIQLTTGAYCNYENDTGNLARCGLLYNWYTIVDSRNLCPTGWHVPSAIEWGTLCTFANTKFEATGLIDFPSGYRTEDGLFYSNGGWWGSTSEDFYTPDGSMKNAWRWGQYCGSIVSEAFGHGYKTLGMSVRCLKD